MSIVDQFALAASQRFEASEALSPQWIFWNSSISADRFVAAGAWIIAAAALAIAWRLARAIMERSVRGLSFSINDKNIGDCKMSRPILSGNSCGRSKENPVTASEND